MALDRVFDEGGRRRTSGLDAGVQIYQSEPFLAGERCPCSHRAFAVGLVEFFWGPINQTRPRTIWDQQQNQYIGGGGGGGTGQERKSLTAANGTGNMPHTQVKQVVVVKGGRLQRIEGCTSRRCVQGHCAPPDHTRNGHI